ncbi:MAG: TetR/AcrR family transcriptional regulator [Actinomycetota bacterium]|nr:TetR/AcrR family transcriptional regulator [Actinomycetota bacterium]
MASDAPVISDGPEAQQDAGGGLTDRLLQAAAQVFAEKGYEKAGVAEIARRAGVTTGAIYSRYGGKAELLLEAVDHHVPDSIDSVLNGSGNLGSPTEVLSMLGDHLLDPLDGGHGLFLEAIVAARRDPDLAERLRLRVEDEDRRLGKLVDEATSDGLFDADLDEQAIVRLAHAIGLGMLLTRSMGLSLPSPDHWHTVIDRVLGGLAEPDGPVGPVGNQTPGGDA